MARLVLKFEDQVLKESVVGAMATIGRLPDNAIVIDNPAVSGHHATVFRDGDQFILEDLNSTNGTFVNEKRVSRHTLQDGDVLLVGKHQIAFDRRRGSEDSTVTSKSESSSPDLGDATMFLDTRKHRELIAKFQGAPQKPGVNGPAGPSAQDPVGVLHVISGPAEQSEYPLEARTSLIGKSKTSAVRLKGWFKPKVAVAITRNRQGYVATMLAGKTTINNELGSGRHDLKDGDILAVSGLTLEFRLRQGVSSPR